MGIVHNLDQALSRGRSKRKVRGGVRHEHTGDDWFRRALYYDEEGTVDKAIAAYQQALAVDPLHSASANNLGVIYQDRGDLDAARLCFHYSMRVSPEDALASYNLGKVLDAQEKLYAAAGAYGRAIRRDIFYHDAHHYLAAVHKVHRHEYKAKRHEQICLQLEEELGIE